MCRYGWYRHVRMDAKVMQKEIINDHMYVCVHADVYVHMCVYICMYKFVHGCINMNVYV